jgi:hypothetical protein
MDALMEANGITKDVLEKKAHTVRMFRSFLHSNVFLIRTCAQIEFIEMFQSTRFKRLVGTYSTILIPH